MTQQIGFDFGEAVTHVRLEHPAGSWDTPEYTNQQFTAIFAKAESALQAIACEIRDLFARGIKKAREEQSRLSECNEEGEGFRIANATVEASEDEFQAFFALCSALNGTAGAGIEYKVCRRLNYTTYAMYVQDVGTLSAYDGKHRRLGYSPFREDVFLQSVFDNAIVIEAPEKMWRPAYCADKLAYSNNGIASVRSCTVNGRRYITTAIMGGDGKSEGYGWTFCRKEDWHGETYSYQSRNRAVDNGILERGDHRGTLLRVDGQLCVIDGFALFVDNNPDRSYSYLMASDEESENVSDFVDEEEEDEELAEA